MRRPASLKRERYEAPGTETRQGCVAGHLARNSAPKSGIFHARRGTFTALPFLSEVPPVSSSPPDGGRPCPVPENLPRRLQGQRDWMLVRLDSLVATTCHSAPADALLRCSSCSFDVHRFP
ncbi:hypothetical protein NDU88_011066 [Pleurodeles waltl]|uniref:Uncharacterized protein n=1 Tax=Pleurodeles waltl TaxID=8319 RepID=A0AAV7QW63_PLEWA|nr:hypothetical protein NDU88_011066 [Pleurodeles waltl]